MELKNYYAQDSQGNIMPGADCTLYLAGTSDLASGLQDANGNPMANPFKARSDGLVQFAAPNGRYDLQIAKDGRLQRIRIQCNDVAGNVLVADLSDPDKGAAMVAYEGGTVADKLDEIVSGAVTEPFVDEKVDGHNSDANAHPELRAEIDGQVAVAEAAADRAETASDAAFVNADVYPSVAEGRAAVSEGDQFQVVSGDEVVRYLATGTASSVEVARYPGSTMVRRSALEITRGIQVANQSPNLLSEDTVNAWEMPEATGSFVEPLSVRGINSISCKAQAASTEARVFWSMPASAFSSGLISASVLLVSANSGTGGGVRVIQRNSAGGQLVSTKVGADVISAITEPVAFSIAGVPLHPSAVRVDLNIYLLDTENPGQREFVAQFPMLADGSVAGFRPPPSQSVQRVADLVTLSTGVSQKTYPLPLNVTAVDSSSSGRTLTVQPVQVYGKTAAALNVTLGGSESGGVTIVEVGETLRDGEIVRMSATYVSGTTGALGILFGSTASAKGFVTRANGQALSIDFPAGVTSIVAPPTPRSFVPGERITVDARLFGGVAGNYTVRFFVEYADGARLGPYDIEGVPALDGIFFGCRGSSSWSNVTVTRHGQALYPQDGAVVTAETVVYVAKTGSDSGNGSPSAPFKTINRAVTEVVESGGIIEIEGGDYREAVVVNSQNNVWLRSKKGERVNILGSEQLAITKTPGYTQVYQAPLATKPIGMGAPRGLPVIFEWGTPSKPIPAEERHPLQRGRSHRLPYTEMFEAASLAELDTIDGRGKWWWSDGVIYLAATDGSDARNGRYEARARRAFRHTAGGLRMSRIDVYFSSAQGVSFEGDLAVTEDVGVFGSHHNGFYHTSGVWHSFRDEAAGNGNDGFNGTVTGYAIPDSANRITAVVHDPYGHDNGDDGTSYHYRADQTVYGGLFEHNTKADVVHVTGASVTCFDTVARGSAHGFYTATPPDLDGDRVVTTLRCVNTEAYDNQYSYRAASGGVMLCSNAVAVNPTVRGYDQSGDGVLRARNSRYTGDPAKMKGGDVVVINDGALT